MSLTPNHCAEPDAWARALRLTSEELLSTDCDEIRTYRRADAGGLVRPGDLIAPAEDLDLAVTDTLPWVHPKDVQFTATGDLVYCPNTFYRPGMEPRAYLEQLGQSGRGRGRERLFEHGELAGLASFWTAIERIRSFAMGCDVAASELHGPDHWSRVQSHGIAIARSLGIDPLLPYLFGLVHDSHRHDDDGDPGHGPRAAVFVREQRNGLFAFLSDEQVQQLRDACKAHSIGQTNSHSTAVRACWDADRLDLARPGVDIEPDPRRLCTDYAQRPEVIDFAVQTAQGELPRRTAVLRYA